MWHVVIKTSLERLHDLRLFVPGALASFLLAVSTVPNIISHARELEVVDAQVRQAARDRSLEWVTLVRPSNSFDFIRESAGALAADRLMVVPGLVDTPAEDLARVSFSIGGFHLDWSTVVGYVFSLLAILVSYDVISGEKERATLALVSTFPIKRGSFLLGSFLGSLLPIAAFLVLGVLVGLLVALVSGQIALDRSTMMIVGSFVAASLLLIATLSAAACLISVTSARPGACLTLAILVWVGAAILAEPVGRNLALLLRPLPTAQQLELELARARMIFGDRNTVSSPPLREIALRSDLSEVEKLRRVNDLQNQMTTEHEKTLAAYKDEVSRAQERNFARMSRHVALAEGIAALSPIQLYYAIVDRFVGTGDHRDRAFRQAAALYMRQYSEIANRLRQEHRSAAEVSGPSVTEGPYRLQGISRISYEGIELDRGLIPRLSMDLGRFRDPRSALAGCGYLFTLTFVLLVVSNVLVRRIDVR